MASEDTLLVRVEDGSGLVRELELQGTKLTQRSLPREGEPQASSTRFESVREAKEQLEFLLGRYRKQGFNEVSRERRAAAPAAALEFKSHPEYEAACFAAPEDQRPWQIYADWLQERGDPRGELAALFLAGKADAAWKRLELERDALLGPHSERELLDLEITHGFITGATLKCASAESETDLAALTKDFLRRPIARFVSRLRFGLAAWRDNSWSETVKVLCKSAQAKQLKKVEFSDFEHPTWELTRVNLGNLSALWAGLPELEFLRLRGGRGKLGRIEHPKLKTFIRETDGLSRHELGVILTARFPALERLELWTGPGNYSDASSDQFAEVLTGERFPNLRHLAVVNSELTVELVRALGSSELLPKLRVLDLSKGVLTDADADVLLRVAPKFAHLEFDLSENYLSERLGDVREALPRAVLKDQRSEAERYDAVGE